MARIIRRFPVAPSRVFVDSGAWIAGQLRRDQYHSRAIAAWTKLRVERARLVTTTFVLDEVATFIRYREGRQAALTVGSSILESSVLELIDIDRPLLQRAWELFGQVRDSEPSLTDCTSFAVIESLGIGRVFTFDEDFRATGATLLG
ncbi:MAG: PIN domain-containing protein [Candidatus Wallbacteria bacterium]|nr:PIN domain-containing protein [Candidatus Wallbacteria bacterium]